jgi:hypothetical protein
MALQGRLSDMPFADLFSILTRDAKNGLLIVDTAQERGRLYIHEGQPLSAMVVRLTNFGEDTLYSGEDAVHQMSVWENGSFSFTTCETALVERNIFQDKRDLMLANIFKQSNFKQPEVQPVAEVKGQAVSPLTQELYPKLLPDCHSKLSKLQLSTNEWQVLVQINSKTNVEEVATGAKVSIQTAYNCLKSLVIKGLIEVVRQANKVSAPLPLKQPKYAEPRPRLQLVAPFQSQLAYASTAPSNVVSSRFHAMLVNRNAPKRGLLSSIMAKIRGL